MTPSEGAGSDGMFNVIDTQQTLKESEGRQSIKEQADHQFILH